MRGKKQGRLASLGLGLLIGLLGAMLSLLPVTAAWEEGVGLGLLFQWRGQRPAPTEVAIVSINGETGAQLGLGEEIPEWPRGLHAKLIDRLRAARVSAIAIDIFFKKPRDQEQDKRLADAISRAQNVVLVAYLEQQRSQSGGQTLLVERLVPPIAPLAQAAAASGPFVLPKVPVRVSRFWTFNGDNALPSLPVLTLQQLADSDNNRLGRLLKNGDQAADPVLLLRPLREDETLRERLATRLQDSDLSPLQRRSWQALLRLTGSGPYPYLNFYGPPASIQTIPYQTLLNADSEWLQELRDKVIFIGYAGDYQPTQQDGFYTVFSQDNGLDLSGVEIAATAFANLFHQETIRPLSSLATALLLISIGLGSTLLLRRFAGSIGVLFCLLLAAGYLGLTYELFTQQQLWLPWFIPLAIQLPLAMILVLSWHYRQMRHSREQLRELFGYYLPGDVIDRLAEDKQQVMEQSDRAFGICLATDARQYTSLSERMKPEALQAFLNRYYELLFAPVRRRDGVVSDVIGDAMLAIWPAHRPDSHLCQQACEAALEITRSLDNTELEPRLPTGIGLHAGELVMSHVGAIDHFEYRAVGDMVNTTTRIESLNKMLGTRILASEDMLPGLEGIVSRELGTFSVAGRQQPIVLHEIAALAHEVSPELLELHRDFAKALATWRTGERQQALAQFEALQQRFPGDGPSLYYIQQYHERRRSRINPSV
jgi:adenylate cyclase